MISKPTPAWPLPFMALVQVWVGAGLISFLRGPDAMRGAGVVVVSIIASLIGLLLVGLAVRNCARLWRVPSGEASWRLVVATALATLAGALLVAGQALSGVWVWESLLVGGVAAYLLVVSVREVRRRWENSNDVRQSVAS